MPAWLAVARSFEVEANRPATTLESVQYAERRGHPKEWTLDGLTLGRIDPIVGTNAAGQSRTIDVINHPAKMLTPEPHRRAVFAGHDVSLESEGRILGSVVEVDQGKVVEEEYDRDEEPLLQGARAGRERSSRKRMVGRHGSGW